MRRLRRVATALVVLAVVCGLPGVASAQEPQPRAEGGQLLLMMDSSGSMAGPDGTGKTKIDAAKAAIDRAVDTAPPTGRLGLRAYGAALAPDAPGACQDTRLTVPVGAGNQAALRTAAGSLTPRGQTPIGYSLQQAANDFTQPGPREILLVSDGIETCGSDPCAVARQLATQGIDLRIDVVGFQVDQAARDQLRCVANAGHGTYSDAGDGAALQTIVGRTSTRALREYRPGGTPVTGTPDPAVAPVLAPGQYLDSVPDVAPNADDATKWYAFDRRPGETIYVSATVVPPSTAPLPAGADGVRVRIVSDHEGHEINCGVAGDGGLDFNAGDNYVPTTTTATLSSTGSERECDHPGRFRFSVVASADGVPFPRAPVEIQVLAEPPVTDTASLPPADQTELENPALTPTGSSAPVGGAGRYTDAPTITPGSYDDTILRGETLFYRVRLDWGQRLLARIDTLPGPDPDAPDYGDTLRVDTYGPNRGELRQYESARTGGTIVFPGPRAQSVTTATPIVRYLNRGTSQTSTGNSGIQDASLAGYYYVGVQLRVRRDDPPKAVAAPFRLTVAVVGQPGGAPVYQDVGGGADPARQQDAVPADRAAPDTGTGSGPTATALVATIGAGALVLVGGVAVGIGLRRRRRRR